MKSTTIVWTIVVIIVIALGVWYWSMTGSGNLNGASNAPYQASPSSSAPAATNMTVVLDTATTGTLGEYLVAANGMTLYAYAKDMPGRSNCTGQCATLWPPYTIPTNEATSSALGSGNGAPGQVGVIARADGTSQITYNNVPLYFYSKDKAIGDTSGQGVARLWSVVPPTVGTATSTGSSTSPIQSHAY